MLYEKEIGGKIMSGKEKSRYIKKEEQSKVDKSSNFKCAWCGVNLMERHHIVQYADGGKNCSDNLILLCPNCHTLVHQGKIIKQELLERKKKLSGEIDRSSGYLSIINKCKVIIGGNIFIDTPNIINYNGENIIRMKVENNNLYISLRLYNKKRNLICWVEDNKWWVENEEIFDFTYTKSTFKVEYDKDISINISIVPETDTIEISGNIYMNGYLLKFDKENIRYFNEKYPQNYSLFKGNIIEKCNCAFKFNI